MFFLKSKNSEFYTLLLSENFCKPQTDFFPKPESYFKSFLSSAIHLQELKVKGMGVVNENCINSVGSLGEIGYSVNAE